MPQALTPVSLFVAGILIITGASHAVSNRF
jgi:hypothetical protein